MGKMFFRNAKHQNQTEVDSRSIIVDSLNKMCAGDLATRIVIPESDTLFPIAEGINKLCEHYAKTITDFTLSMTELVASAIHQGVTLNLLSDEFDVQAEIIKQVAAASEEMTASVVEVASSTAKTAEHATCGNETANSTKQQVVLATKDINEANECLTRLKPKVMELEESAQKIDNFVGIVENIAGQTNLLALNAAIEAARAGEQGRGFGVVATEVRNLAEQSKQSVGEINSQVVMIKQEVSDITTQFDTISKLFASNVEASMAASNSVEKLTTVFTDIGSSVNAIAPIAEEQSASLQEISASIDNASQGILRVNDEIQECNHDLFTLINKAEAIRGQMNNLKIDFAAENILELAKTDHMLWKARVDYMLKGFVRLDADKIEDHRDCRLGKWYFGSGKDTYGSYAEFIQLDNSHAKFHKACANAIKYYQAGDKQSAQKMAAEINSLSTEVLALIDNLKAVSRK